MKTYLKSTGRVLAASCLFLLGGALANGQTLNVTNGLTLWLKADALTGLTNGQSVATWNDSSTNGNDATQGSGSMQPTYVSNGLAGLPVLSFSGDNLVTPSIAALSSLSVFMVARSADLGDRYALQFGHDTRAVIEGYGSGNWRWFNTPSIVTLQPMSTAIFQTIWTTNGASSAGAWHIGADASVTAPFSGSIAEVIVYDHALSAAESQDVAGYLNAKWAIPEPSSVALLALGGLLALRGISRGTRSNG